MKLIETRNLTFVYPNGTKALDNVSIRIKKGDFTCILGLNGTGKSTLLQHFNGLLEPTSGEVMVDGQCLDKKIVSEIRQKVGMVFQNPDDQLFELTVGDDVAYGPRNLKLPEEEIKKRVKDSLRLVDMEEFEDTNIEHLSLGQKKRVSIAGVLAMNPEILVFDEPLSNLDPSGMDNLLGLMEELQHMGKTIVIATHNVDVAYQWADYVYLLKDGRVLEHGTPLEIFTHPSLLKRAGMRQPQILKVYSELKGRGLANGTVPRNTLELMDTIPEKTIKMNGVGKIYVAGVSEAGSVPRDVHYLGILGTKAKLGARELDLTADFYSDVINNCLLKATGGSNCLIIASGGMIEHTRKRVEEYNKESGFKIHVEILTRDVV